MKQKPNGAQAKWSTSQLKRKSNFAYWSATKLKGKYFAIIALLVKGSVKGAFSIKSVYYWRQAHKNTRRNVKNAKDRISQGKNK